MTYTPQSILVERLDSGSGTTITFSNIPASGYNNLLLKGRLRTTISGALDTLAIFYNNDLTTTNYRVRDSPGGSQATAGQYLVTLGNTATSGFFGYFNHYIYKYTSNEMKVSLQDSPLTATTSEIYWYARAQSWNSTAAITRIDIKTISQNYITGGWVELWALV